MELFPLDKSFLITRSDIHMIYFKYSLLQNEIVHHENEAP